ncbi:nuclear transport factor 2 family protein [Microbispora sp. H10836]|uniref:nuclear transport factor 2 family protein n=1 Tax=Microbispora sp. H10836 TaxID=2729106 RepID=UPI001473D840|nr:nuclear transport factor 2 family protein [Microbispora sp. H10836]
MERTQDELIALETAGWAALSSTPEAATEFYEQVLDRTVVMLLPGGMVLDDRAAIVKSMAGQPWSSHELQDARVVHLTDDTGLVTYGVVAERDGDSAYSALMSSLYVRRQDGWKLAFHQQTPR